MLLLLFFGPGNSIYEQQMIFGPVLTRLTTKRGRQTSDALPGTLCIDQKDSPEQEQELGNFIECFASNVFEERFRLELIYEATWLESSC